MANLCGWASGDEKGKATGGKAGNQTGKELKVGNWNDFGQTIVLRFKDRALAKEYAEVIKAICLNPCVGYDQGNRTSLHTELAKVNYDVSKLITPCECDCSALVGAGLNAVGIKVNPSIYTGNMVEAIMRTGKFEKLTAKKYTDSGDYQLTGDISVKEKSHTMSALEDGVSVFFN